MNGSRVCDATGCMPTAFGFVLLLLVRSHYYLSILLIPVHYKYAREQYKYLYLYTYTIRVRITYLFCGRWFVQKSNDVDFCPFQPIPFVRQLAPFIFQHINQGTSRGSQRPCFPLPLSFHECVEVYRYEYTSMLCMVQTFQAQSRREHHQFAATAPLTPPQHARHDGDFFGGYLNSGEWLSSSSAELATFSCPQLTEQRPRQVGIGTTVDKS